MKMDWTEVYLKQNMAKQTKFIMKYQNKVLQTKQVNVNQTYYEILKWALQIKT